MNSPLVALALALCAAMATAQADEPDAKPRIRPSVERMRVPAGYTKEQLVLGDRIFNGEAAGGKCVTCHGADAKGTVIGTTDLTTGMYAWADGSVSGIKQGITDRMHTAPGMDGDLQPNDVVAVAVYVWALAHQTP